MTPDAIDLATIAIATLAVSGIVALFASSRAAPRIAAAGALAAAAIGIAPAMITMYEGSTHDLVVAWPAPLNELTLRLDALSAFFMVPLLVLGAACAIYAVSYLDPKRRLGVPSGCFNLLLAAMLLVLVARNGIVLLFGWEVMTLSSYLLVTFDHEQQEVRRAGWVYLIAGHLGFACLIVVFCALAGDTGFDWTAGHTGTVATIVLVFSILGFGVKAGVVPLHVWLPEAHAAAPSHVSAMMSGGMIKLGIYGILRMITLVELPHWLGPLLASLGVVSAIAGIALGLYQRDLKRTLAYSSIENIGVILLGLGLGLFGISEHRPSIAAFGLIGGLLHVWSHVLMKGTLFLGAGSVLHATGTRDIERHGGLLQRMPRTGLLLMLGAAAITALPPLAGFASEWLVYLGLLDGGVRTNGTGLWMMLGVAALAMVGVLATFCFVRAIGLSLLGQPRSPEAAGAHESGRGLLAPIAPLAIGIVAMPFVAWLAVPLLDSVASQIAGTPVETARVVTSLQTIAIVSGVVWLAFGLGSLVLYLRARRRRVDDTWGCGYVAPTARMQYTSGSFSEAAHILLPRLMRPQVAIRRGVGPFPAPGELTSDRRDPFTRSGYEPAIDQLQKRAVGLRWVQQGLLHIYLLFIVATVVVGLAAVSIYDAWVR